MNNGNSSLINGLSANLLAAITLFVGALVSFVAGFRGWWFIIVLIALTAILFFLDRNSFVRKACLNSLAVCAVCVVSKLLFKIILHWAFFSVIHWIIAVCAVLILIYCGLCALNGKEVNLPFIGDFIDSVC